MMLFNLAWKSLLERRVSVFLTIVTICISVFIAAGVAHVRNQAQSSFDRTISGVDLIIGPRTSQINLMLYSVFRIGYPGNGISWESFELIKSDNRVAWIIPVSLGDSHQGFRVVGTNNDYFEHYQFGQRQSLAFDSGGVFASVHDAVIGADVARELGYQTGDTLTLSHGVGTTSFQNHDNVQFTVSGILTATGTPVDQAVHVTLQGLESAHGNVATHQHAVDEEDYEHEHGHEHEHDEDHAHEEDTHAKHLQSGSAAAPDTFSSVANAVQPSQITAAFVGLHNRAAVFALQQAVNEYPSEPLTGALPGVALAELWQMMGMVENILLVISVLVLISSLTGLSTMLLSSMRERRHEIFLYRAVGMPSRSILLLVEAEAVLITALGILSGFALLFLVTSAGQDFLSMRFGIFISQNPINQQSLFFALVILVVAALLALIPAISAYRSSLGSQLTT
ncbi:MAG: ABC transporter permease [Pseudohongiella sp.]|uniref:ABC transporter permease n=1 Tax=Pseudohongiella sp. TaxID=1979412 RepID=UPI0034A011B1